MLSKSKMRKPNTSDGKLPVFNYAVQIVVLYFTHYAVVKERAICRLIDLD